MPDILILNGFVADGTGNPRYRSDIAITGDRITEMGNLRGLTAKKVIDAGGKLVCPGLIDAHSHSDATVEYNPYFESTLRQGITTEIVGNCGNSTAPFPLEGAGGGGFGKFGDLPIPYGRTLGAHMAALETRGISANLAWLVGHNTLRSLAGVKGARVSEQALAEMKDQLARALEDGALGLSSGLEFEPGRGCRPEELVRLAQVLADYDAIYTSHIRNRDAQVLLAVDEFIDLIRAHKIRGQISHMNIRHNTHAPENAVQRCMEKIEQARAEGLDILTDMTPLNYGIGQMAGILPNWLTDSPPEQLREMLLDPAVRERLRDDCDRYWRFIYSGEWGRVRMQSNAAYPEINGLTFPEIAALWNKDPWDCYFDILAAAAPDLDQVVLVSYLFTDAHLRETISHPLYMLVVDGYSTAAQGQIAQYTRFPLHYIGMAWFLTHHVRECGTLRLEEAIRKMTSMPATHFRLKDRGLLREGCFADICIFDPEQLETPFDLQNPAQYTRGMEYVFVNGQPVIEKGIHLHTTPGRNLKR